MIVDRKYLVLIMRNKKDKQFHYINKTIIKEIDNSLFPYIYYVSYIIDSTKAFNLGTIFVGYYKKVITVRDLTFFIDAVKEIINVYREKSGNIVILSYTLLENK